MPKAHPPSLATLPEPSSIRTVMVTGGAVGIGAAVVRRFASAGWNVICHYHSSEEQAGRLREECIALGVHCTLLQADLSTEVGINHLLERLQDHRVDSLVNNAGAYLALKPFTEMRLADLTPAFLVNLAAPFLLASSIFQDMCDREFGRIVNISSIAAKYGGSVQSMHYGCFKRGMEGITKTLSRLGAAKGVLVNTVRPGVINTPFHEKYPKDMQQRIQLIPAKRMGTALEVAETIFFLGSDMNTYMTGEEIAVAGGE